MDDLISRQAAIDALKELTANGTNKGMVFGKDAVHRIEMLPSAQPKRGKWQYHSYIPHNKYCPKCKKDSPYNKRWDFCPNCGAKMEVNYESN